MINKLEKHLRLLAEKEPEKFEITKEVGTFKAMNGKFYVLQTDLIDETLSIESMIEIAEQMGYVIWCEYDEGMFLSMSQKYGDTNKYDDGCRYITQPEAYQEALIAAIVNKWGEVK